MKISAATPKQKVRVGTRGSALAVTQTKWVCDWLAGSSPDITIEVVTIRTTGDIRSSEPISAMAGRGVFVDAIERALLAGEIDFAVHSAKDLPARDASGLRLAACPPREDARDVLISRDGSALRALPPGVKIGTSSQRRTSQAAAIRPDASFLELRGNVDTRLRKVAEGRYDAVILAAAGLNRLGLSSRVSEWLSVEDFVPAPAQGALAVQVREDDAPLTARFAGLNDDATSRAVAAERSFLSRLGSGCTLPVGAYGIVSGRSLTLKGYLCSVSGAAFRLEKSGPSASAESIGASLAEELSDLCLANNGR